jgi:hypothetical protein
MRRVLTIAVALAAVLALFGGSASAAVLVQLGRTDQNYSHLNDPARGEFKVAVAGELVDGPDGDGVADALGGATRMTKIRGVLRLQVDSVFIQRQIGGVWQPAAGVFCCSNSGAASSVLVKIDATSFCTTGTTLRLYRIRQAGSIRWSDGSLGRQVQFSGLFRDRLLSDDPDCMTPPIP